MMSETDTATKPIADPTNPVYLTRQKPAKFHSDNQCRWLHNAKTCDEILCIPRNIAESRVVKELFDQSIGELTPCEGCIAETHD
jgi:hypothetical protein